MRSTITGVINNVSAKEALQVLCFGMHLENIRVVIISPHLSRRTLWLNFIFEGNILEKNVKSPKYLGINTNASCMNVSSRKSKYHAFVFQISFLKEILSLCKASDAKLPLSLFSLVLSSSMIVNRNVVVKSCI